MNVVDFISILWYYMCIYKNGDIFMIQPEIRFKGFTDEWSTSVLGDVLKIPAKIEANVKSNSDLLTVKLHGGGVHQMSSNKVLSIGATKYYIRKAGQLIYGKQNFFNGSMAIIPLELDGKASSGDVPVFDITGADSIFLYQKISQPSFYERTKDLASGTGSKRLHEKTVQRLPIQLPTLPEQQKIGALFSKYDAIIALREQKLAELNALKKGMLQQMFDDGVTTSHKPQVRFSGFNDEWVEKKLGDVSDKVIKGSAKADSLELGQNAVYLDTKYLNTKSNPIMTSANANVSENDVLILWDGSNAGVVYKGVNGVLGSTLKSLKINSGTSSDYVYQILKNSESIIFDRYRTPNIPHVVKDFTQKFKIQLPTLPEQQKIGQLFKHLDARISNEQSKIEQLKAQKQGLLQKML